MENKFPGKDITDEDLKTALNTLLNAEERAPKNAGIKASLAEVYYRQNKREEADEMLEKCLALEPDNALGLAIKQKSSVINEPASEH